MQTVPALLLTATARLEGTNHRRPMAHDVLFHIWDLFQGEGL